jgi:hypothetical protein
MPLGYGIVPGDGAGGFGELVPVADGLFDDRSFNSKLAVGDVTGDGSLEAIAWGHTLGDYGVEDSSVVALSASGTVVAEWHDPGAGYFRSFAVADVDGDGADDIAIAINRDEQTLDGTEIVLLRSTPDGLGPFGSQDEPTVFTPRTRVRYLDLTDMNADGHVDLVATPGLELGQPGWCRGGGGRRRASHRGQAGSITSCRSPSGSSLSGTRGIPGRISRSGNRVVLSQRSTRCRTSRRSPAATVSSLASVGHEGRRWCLSGCSPDRRHASRTDARAAPPSCCRSTRSTTRPSIDPCRCGPCVCHGPVPILSADPLPGAENRR